MKRTLLVTGGAGFIGSNFVRYMLRRIKLKIINLDKLTYSGNLKSLRDIRRNPRYKFVKGDICDKKLVFKLARNCDAIINFAAESHVDRSIKDPTGFIRTNVFGTQVLLDAARKFNIKRYIQISTDEVYGSIREGKFDEFSPLRPNSPYAASKAAADLLVRSYCVTYKLPTVIVRSSNNFGPYQYPEKIIPLFVTNLLEGKKVPVYATGKNEREWLYVMDNCEAIRYVLEYGKPGEIYNVGSGTILRNIGLTSEVLKMLDKDEKFIKFVKDRPGHDKRYALNSSKIRKLGWKPKHNFKEALRETVSWYKENTKWWKRLKKRKEEKFW